MHAYADYTPVNEGDPAEKKKEMSSPGTVSCKQKRPFGKGNASSGLLITDFFHTQIKSQMLMLTQEKAI